MSLVQPPQNKGMFGRLEAKLERSRQKLSTLIHISEQIPQKIEEYSYDAESRTLVVELKSKSKTDVDELHSKLRRNYTVLNPAQKLVFSNILTFYQGNIMACVNDLLEYYSLLQKKKESLACQFTNLEQEKTRREKIRENLHKDLERAQDELGAIIPVARNDMLQDFLKFSRSQLQDTLDMIMKRNWIDL